MNDGSNGSGGSEEMVWRGRGANPIRASLLPQKLDDFRTYLTGALHGGTMAAAWEELESRLWKPRLSQVFHVDALAILGTGKLDPRGVKALAAGLA